MTSPGQALPNLPALREIGFSANRRLVEVQRTSCNCAIGEEAFAQVCGPVVVQGQRGPALRCGDPRVQAQLSIFVVFRLLPVVLQPRPTASPCWASTPVHMTTGRMT